MSKRNSFNSTSGPNHCINVLEGQSNLLKGGSIASDLVNQLSPKEACQTLPQSIKSILAKDFVIANYGSSFKTSGGGQKFGVGFIEQIAGNLKKKMSMKKVLQKMRQSWDQHQKTKLSDRNSKLILNDLLQSNPKIKQAGGRIVLPSSWFNPRSPINFQPVAPGSPTNCPSPRQLPTTYTNFLETKYPERSCMTGGGGYNVEANDIEATRFLPFNRDATVKTFRVDGDSNPFGANIPINPMQKFTNWLSGAKPLFAPSRSDVTNLQDANLFCGDGQCNFSRNLPNQALLNPKVPVDNFPANGQPNTIQATIWPDSVANPTVHVPQVRVPFQRAGSRKKTKSTTKSLKKK